MSAPRKASDYSYFGPYDEAAFSAAYAEQFAKVPKFNQPSIPDLLFVLKKIGADSRINDIRWAAYLLGTTYVESSHTVKITKVTQGKKGRAKTHQVKVWRNFAPIEEAGHGKGRKYYLPVKVTRLPSGDARVVEYDGDTWTISAHTGHSRAQNKHQERGVAATASESEAYKNDEGDEQLYYGRGFVQLTWWSGYANAGVELGRGLELLFDPDLVDERETAYQILATGMYTGKIYANGRTLARYFHGSHTDYVGARDMVNPGAKHANKVEVAEIARRFEDVLFAARLKQAVAAG
ncbi:MAG TPA: glycoside hydrolase [Polyangia bacterium]